VGSIVHACVEVLNTDHEPESQILHGSAIAALMSADGLWGAVVRWFVPLRIVKHGNTVHSATVRQ
jgi:hypothetical protein